MSYIEKLWLNMLSRPFNLLFGSAALMLPFAATALSEQCLQLPQRNQACAHLLYKRSPIDVPQLAVKQGEVICLCLSDLRSVSDAQLSAVEKIDIQADWLQLSRHYQLTEQQILRLVHE